ncbi:metal-sensing transcriptional repressor [Pseudoroseicyclus sp. H15]
MTERHASHPEIVKRLNRANGHLKSVVAMIEAGRPCADIAQQLHAVERAVASAKRTLIQDHMDHCLAPGRDVGELEETLDEFRKLTRYL